MKLIDSATAAVALSVTERTIRRMVASGKLANHGTARRILIDLADLVHVR